MNTEIMTDDGGLADLISDLQCQYLAYMTSGTPVDLYFIGYKNGVGQWRVLLDRSQRNYLISKIPRMSLIDKYGRDV